MTARRDLAAPACPSLVKKALPKMRGRRECRARRAHPRPRARKTKSTRVSPPQVRRTSRHSLRDGFNGFLRGLPGEPGFLATVPAQCEALSRVDTSVGVSGRHDFTVRDTRSRQARASRPSHPAPNVRDDRETPLLIGRGAARLMDLICPTAQAKGLRQFGTTGKSLWRPKILSSD
jgi:hypothetical protein